MSVNENLYNELQRLINQKDLYENMIKNMEHQMDCTTSYCKISLLNVYSYEIDNEGLEYLIRCYRKKLIEINNKIDQFNLSKTVY